MARQDHAFHGLGAFIASVMVIMGVVHIDVVEGNSSHPSAMCPGGSFHLSAIPPCTDPALMWLLIFLSSPTLSPNIAPSSSFPASNTIVIIIQARQYHESSGWSTCVAHTDVGVDNPFHPLAVRPGGSFHLLVVCPGTDHTLVFLLVSSSFLLSSPKRLLHHHHSPIKSV